MTLKGLLHYFCLSQWLYQIRDLLCRVVVILRILHFGLPVIIWYRKAWP